MQSCKRSSGPAGLGIETRGRSHVAFDETIARLDDRIPIDVVVSVPAHHGRTDRFGAYRAAVSEYTGADEAAVIVKREVPERYKSVTKAARRRGPVRDPRRSERPERADHRRRRQHGIDDRRAR